MRHSLGILIVGLTCLLCGQVDSAGDALLKKAREAETALTQTLPNFLCQERITRFRKGAAGEPWQQRDVVSAEVDYDAKTGESFRIVQGNGTAAGNEMLDLSGSSSPRQFCLGLRNLFESSADSDYLHVAEADASNETSAVYDYTVNKAASNWQIKAQDAIATPAYRGRVWIDRARGLVLRLEMSANSFPLNFPAGHVSEAVDYGSVNVGTVGTYFLPVRAEIVICWSDGGACDRNQIEFRDYRESDVEPPMAFAEPPKNLALSPTASAAQPARVAHTISREPLFTFVGLVRPGERKSTFLELDDERFIVIDARGNAPVSLHPGDRVKVQCSEYDGHGLLVDSLSVLQAAGPADATSPKAASAPVSADPILAKVRENVADMLKSLPNFLCRQIVKRYENWPAHKRWQLQDSLSAEVLYSRKTGEEYRDIQIDGKPTTKSWLELGGDVSTGEFGSLLGNLLSAPGSDFQFVKTDRVNRLEARQYGFRVTRPQSTWNILSDYQFITTWYSGWVWIDKNSNQVLKIERQAEQIPSAFPISSVEGGVTYGEVRLGPSETFLLPVHAETRACVRETSMCSRKTIEFRDYRRFTGESKIIF